MPDLLPTPLELAGAPTLPAVLDAYAAAYPDQLLVIADDLSATARELADSARRFATHLRDQGLGKGDVVGVLMPNGWRWLVIALGAHYAAVTCVPLNTFYKESELREAVERTHLCRLYAERQFFGRDYAALLNDAGLLEAAEAGPFGGTTFWTSGARSPETVDLDALAPCVDALPGPEETAFYVFTSGSSARPKIVVLNHGNLVLNCYEIGRRQHVEVGDRLWMASPMFFGYGCANALLVVLTHGLTFCLQERFDPTGSAEFMARHGCTVYYGLGGMTRELVAAGAHKRHDLSRLRTGTTGFSSEDKRLAIEVLGVTEVCSVYGLTEGNGHSAMTDAHDDVDTKLHTQGTALPTQEMRINDTTSGQVIPPGDDARMGEIQLRGCVSSGYLEDPETNVRSFTDDGWFRTGDLGWLDSRGRLHFAGRLKEVIKVQGITVSPAEVEALALEHRLVDQAWAFGWPVAEGHDDRLCCAVVLTSRGDRSDEDVCSELRTWMKARISTYKVPEVFVVITEDEIPTTATGKVSKRLIGERFVSQSTEGSRA